MRAARGRSVFINCPFDDQYQPLFEAVVFCVAACGFLPRCTLEQTDAEELRIDTIYALIDQCNHGIHDISRTEVATQPFKLPRFNMPLELGIFLGAKRFGRDSAQKRCLVMDRAPYRYKRFISDIGGQDIKAHGNKPRCLIRHVRSWLQAGAHKATVPGSALIWKHFLQFRREIPIVAYEARLKATQLTFIDYLQLVTIWLAWNRQMFRSNEEYDVDTFLE